AAEIMTASSGDFTGLLATLADLEQRLKESAYVPEEQSIGIAATLVYGGVDSETAIQRLADFSDLTSSKEAAAILAITNIPEDWIKTRYREYKDMFDDWGYSTSDDADLAAAYLSISPLEAKDAKDKMSAIVDALRTDLQYPLVAAAILTSMTTLAATEALDLMEKGVTILQTYATDLGRSELVSLAVRMVHGVNNELAQKLDPNASRTNTPVQFTNTQQQASQSAYGPGGFYGGFPIFWWFYFPLIVAHSTYHNTYNTSAGYHEGHAHGVGGFT
ncbi:MAG TPA: hypothetical protein VED17_06175, partial [Nitrososphaerales archaeon]|nr:hypothetical protein [Nitrososphaerales archaeon]